MAISEVQQLRDLTRAFWEKRDIPCPNHPGALMQGEFTRTTYADHLILTCRTGKEAITIPQRPRQQPFNLPQVEGLVTNLQRGDNVLCYRCQSELEISREDRVDSGFGTYSFTCVRCFSWGEWQGNPSSISTVAAKA